MIRTASVKKVLSLLEELAAQQPEKYRHVLEGVRACAQGRRGQDDDGGALRSRAFCFDARRHGGQRCGFADYAGSMKAGQEALAYITADNSLAARNSPHLEIFRKLGVEVLLMHDRVDEWVMSMLTELDGEPLRSVTKEGWTSASSATPPRNKSRNSRKQNSSRSWSKSSGRSAGAPAQCAPLLRLTDSPACLVADEHGLSTNLERMLKAAGQTVPSARPALEVNPRHALVQRMKEQPDEARFADWSHLLSIRPRWRRAVNSTIRPRSSSGSTV